LQLRHQGGPSSGSSNAHNREDQQAQKHEDPLQQIAVSHRFEATHGGVKENHSCSDKNPCEIGGTQEGTEGLTGCGQLGRRVGDHHGKDDPHTEEPEQVL